MLYSELAVKKSSARTSLFVFWDKKCLNYGQNWEDGFLEGIQSSKVVILLMSDQVLTN